ncbi:MAG TPA: right-handed parallel beta-helix repeat-containing protein [Pyrinomonadaceae bacterium]|nr:right-handed parallel beta-helix repeat-containing protein [Pyrinomonadaceae bacterium]
MTKGRLTLNILTTITFIFALAAMTHAQATRTWVSGVGDDVNPCSRTAPCKTYAGAISKTAKDGEISTLDPGGFGTLTITKSITVNGGGGGQGYGSVLSALAPQGFLINITDAADVRKTVRLIGLDINGASSGTDGVRMIAGLALHIENTNIDGLTGDGVDINIAGANVTELYMKNVSIRNCVGNGVITQATNAAGLIAATLINVQANNCGDGFEAGARSLMTLTDCVASTNNGAGAAGVRVSGATADVNITNCTLAYNTSGVRVDAGTARVANTTLSSNSTGLHNVAGTLKTFGTNRNDGGTPTSGVITPISQT